MNLITNPECCFEIISRLKYKEGGVKAKVTRFLSHEIKTCLMLITEYRRERHRVLKRVFFKHSEMLTGEFSVEEMAQHWLLLFNFQYPHGGSQSSVMRSGALLLHT